jgi:hypothetical protein
MNTLKFALVAIVFCSGLASCSTSVKSVSHLGKKSPCFFSDEKGTIRPFQSNEERVTEHYHFRNALSQE